MPRWLIALGFAAGAAITAPGLRAQTQTPNPHGTFVAPCAQCHRPDAWRPIAIASTFKHAPTRFPLEGAHTQVACTTCHKALDFSGVPKTCASCHRDVHQGALGASCASCHTQRSFTDRTQMRSAHQLGGFPLTGAHAAVECTACHTPRAQGQQAYISVPTDCASCHQRDYESAKTPDHAAAGFPKNCSSCHTSTAWRGAPFDHDVSRFPLTGSHRSVTCEGCHGDGVYHGKPTTCVACHQATFTATRSPPHAAAGFATSCEGCHTTATWSGAPFDHSTTQFALTGAHGAASCASCHSDGVYHAKPTTCVSCHQTKYASTTSPPHAAAAFPTSCEGCHGTTAWMGTPFDHSRTQFALTGAHHALDCRSCHSDGVYHGKATTCVSCHQTNYNRTTTPPHGAAGFSTNCVSCHTATTWTGAPFDHNTTQFALTGAHRAATCVSCHGDGVYHAKPTACVSCHQANFDGTQTPPHRAAGFATTCQNCHTTTAWLGAPFDHSVTQFPLTGGHRAVNCASCHNDGVYHGKATTCVSCHQPDYDRAQTPPHRSAGFPTSCLTCHTTTTWTGAPFDHNATQFPLTGLHATTACSACHGDGVYHGKPTACASCHQPDYNGTTNPPHGAAGFPTTCQTCHTTSRWLGAPFDHNATQFPLTGAHRAVNCASCHSDGVYHGKATTCVSCHQPEYAGTTNPPHVAAGFPTTCLTCHTTTTWTGSSFNHSTTQFPLTGMHTTTACSACHGDGVYHGKPTACASCHQADYNRTANPPHGAAGFPTTCQTCHTTSRWLGAPFDHNTTQFPLTGAHRAVNCAACHGDGVYHGKATTCVSCHQPDYAGTTNPPHVAAGFSTGCQTCHTTTVWTGATFNHAATQFPLTGAHVSTACAACHGDGVYHGKPTTCVSCHQTDFNNTINPNHRTAMFPTDCVSCHTTATWTGATFDHDARYFPIYSGAHRGRWATCATCHTNPNNYAVFDCLSCHQRTQTDNEHRGRNGYVYASPNCYACHPRGRSG